MSKSHDFCIGERVKLRKIDVGGAMAGAEGEVREVKSDQIFVWWEGVLGADVPPNWYSYGTSPGGYQIADYIERLPTNDIWAELELQ